MGRTRTFIAVEISDEIRRRAREMIGQLNAVVDDVKWVAVDNLHWTLQFLGDVEELEIPAVCTAVAEAAAKCEPFELAARGAGAFPTPDRPRTLWIGAGDGADNMIALHKSIEQPLRKLGYRSEQRRFVPHLTLGRVGRNGRPQSLTATLSTLGNFDGGSMLVDEVTVFASQLTREGSVYEPLSRAPLAP